MATGRDYTRFTFDDNVDGMVSSLREDLPQFTETDLNEPLIQFARMVGYIGHRDASMIDLSASELSWPTLQRRRSAVALASLVGQSLLPASPALTDVLLDLIGTPGPADIVLIELGLLRTGGDVDNPSVVFEQQAGDVAVGNREFTTIAEEAGVFTAPVVQTQVAPWTTPAVNDALYYGHAALLFDGIKLTGSGVPEQYTTRLEYYDGRFRRVRPDDGSISVGASGITVGIDGLLGTTDSVTGLVIRIEHNDTEQIQDVVSTFSGTNVIVTNGFLGQSAASTDPNDYSVSAIWLPLTDVAAFTPAAAPYERDLSFLNPSDIQASGAAAERKWQLTTVNGVEAYWLRERIISVTVPVGPTQVDAEVSLQQTWTLQVAALQGETVEDVLGTSTGAAFEEFDLNEDPFIGGSFSELEIGTDIEWSLVDSLLSASAEDKVFILLERVDGTRFISFGDGVNGRIPPPGQVITATYRINANDNGNTGVGTVNNAETGANFLTNARNPRVATGWKEREGDTTASLARVRRLVPAGVRACDDVAVTAEDVEFLSTQRFKTSDGRSPFVRVAVIEQGAGFKTLLAVCVGSAGTVPTDADTTELETYFNGTMVGFQRIGGRCLANQRVIAVPYTPQDTAIVATLKVSKRYATTAKAKAESALLAATSPLAVNGEGIFRHFPGSEVTLAFYLSILGAADIDGLVDVVLTATPSLPFTLAKTSLPRSGPQDALLIPQITIVEV